MARKVRWTKKAEKRFNKTLSYLDKKFGRSSVDKFISRTYGFLHILEDFSQIGTVEDKEKEIYGFVLEKPVTVFYRYTDTTIIILNFYDNRTDSAIRKF